MNIRHIKTLDGKFPLIAQCPIPEDIVFTSDLATHQNPSIPQSTFQKLLRYTQLCGFNVVLYGGTILEMQTLSKAFAKYKVGTILSPPWISYKDQEAVIIAPPIVPINPYKLYTRDIEAGGWIVLEWGNESTSIEPILPQTF